MILIRSYLKCLMAILIITDEHRTPAGLRAPIKTCRYNGSTYQTGEIFANHELFPSRQSNQCVMCTCSVSIFFFFCNFFVKVIVAVTIAHQ